MQTTDYQNFYEIYWIRRNDNDLRAMTSRWLAAKLLTQIPPDLSLNHVVDVGGGIGTLISLLHQAHPFESVWEVDLSSVALTQAREKLPTARFILGSAEHLPFRNGTTDLVVICDLLEHVSNSDRTLTEALRIGSFLLLKVPIEDALLVNLMHRLRGVRYGIKHPSGHLYQWTASDVLALLDRPDLQIMCYEFVRTPYHYLEHKDWLKAIVFGTLAAVEKLLGSSRVSEALVGGSMFILARSRHSQGEV